LNFAIGLAGGTFGSLFGLGGGVIIVPLLVRFLGLPQHTAHGTSLMSLVFTGFVGSLPYLWYRHLDASSAFILALSAMGTAHLGAKFCHTLPERKLKRYFGVFLMVMAFFLLSKQYLGALSDPLTGVARWLTLIGAGLLTGFLSGLMGIGGGAIMIAFLAILLGFDQHLAQGTALLAMIPGGAIGGWTYWKNGQVDKNNLLPLIIGITLGALAGGTLAQYIPTDKLRIFFAMILIGLGYRYTQQKTSKESPNGN